MTNSADWHDEYTADGGSARETAPEESGDESCWAGLSNATRNAGEGYRCDTPAPMRGQKQPNNTPRTPVPQASHKRGSLEWIIVIGLGLGLLGGVGWVTHHLYTKYTRLPEPPKQQYK